MLFNLSTIDHSIIDALTRYPSVLTITPSKTNYDYNEAISTSTISVVCTYTNGFSETVSTSANWGNSLKLLTSNALTDTVTISYTDNGRTIQGQFNITVHRVLASIEVTASRISYPFNSTIDGTTISVTSHYTDGSIDHPAPYDEITNPYGFTFTPEVAKDPNNSALGSTTITVSYGEADNNHTWENNNVPIFTDTFNISFTKVLDHIAITSFTTTQYNYGDTINAASIEVTAYYTGGGFSPAVVNGWTFTPTIANFTSQNSTSTTGKLTVTYNEENVTVSVQTPDITVYKVLYSLTATPSKTAYAYNEEIKKADLSSVEAWYTDGTHKTLNASEFSISPATAKDISNASAQTVQVDVSHAFNGLTKHYYYSVSIQQVPQSLSATLNRSYYTYNQAITVTSCTCTYTNGTSKAVSGYTYSCGSANNHTATAGTVTVSYTENEVSVSRSIPISIVLTAACYSGTANFRDQGNGNWYAELFTNGTFTIPCDMNVDLYMIGGGQGGGAGETSADSGNHNKTFVYGGPGGYGGCIYKRTNLPLTAGQYVCTIGGGGARGGPGTINTRGAVGGSTQFGTTTNFGNGTNAVPIAHGGGVSRTNTDYEYDGAHGGSRGNYVGSYATPSGGFDGDNVSTTNPDLRDWLNYNRGGGGGGGMSEYDWEWAEHYSSTGSGKGGSMGGGNATKAGTAYYGGGGGGGEPGGAGAGGCGVIVIRNAR